MKGKERLFFAFFLVFLIAPVLFMAFFHRRPPWTPRLANHLYDAAALFPRGVDRIPVFYIQTQAGKEGPWTTLDEGPFFPLSKGLGGYRSRFSRFTEIYFAQDGPVSRMAGDALAAWFYQRFGELYPNAAPPASFRILRASYTVGSREPAQGRWMRPPLESFQGDEIEVAYANFRA